MCAVFEVSKKDVQGRTIARAGAASGDLGPAAGGWAGRGQARGGRRLLSCLALSARALRLLLLNVQDGALACTLRTLSAIAIKLAIAMHAGASYPGV